MQCVLVVEDNSDLRLLYRQAMKNEGVEALMASNGLEALNLLKTSASPRPAVILLDLMMPVMDGWEFLRQKADDPALRDIPVVICSASRDNIPANVQVLKKPVDLDALLDLVQRYCA